MAKITENPKFLEGKCYFVALLWPNITCRASQCWLGHRIGSVGSIQFLTGSFRLFHKFLAETLWKKEFPNKLHYLKFGPFSVPQNDNITGIDKQFKQCVQQCVLMQVSTASELLSWMLPKTVKKLVSLNFVDSSYNFLSRCTNNKTELGFVTPIGLPREAVESLFSKAFLGYARS